MRRPLALVALAVIVAVSGSIAHAEDKLAQARTSLRKGDLGAAHAAAEAVARAPGKAQSDGRTLLGEIQRAQGKTAEARQLLEEIVKKEPKNLRARWLLGLVY